MRNHRLCWLPASSGHPFSGLKRLEYRGYDSAGLAWREHGRIERVRAVGNLDSLSAALALGTRGPTPAIATARHDVEVGIGHTRWATHGGVTERNAHPHADAAGRVWIVLNGIIENHLELRRRLTHDMIAVQLRDRR